MSEHGATERDIRLVERIGAGGMGEVYRGVQETLGREVAVKIIRAERRLDASAKARFLREARILSRLEHPNICRLYDYVEGEESDFIVLELVRGRSLREILDGGLTDPQRMSIAEQVAAALVAAHSISVVHRDLKPDNIMVADDGTVKVLDFGLARPVMPDIDAKPQSREQESFDPKTVELGWTRLGEIVGTPRYMSPEQARGDALTAAADMYVFGLLLQELWTGKPPYGEDLTVAQLVRKAMWGELARPEGIDPQVAGLIAALTAFEPGERPGAAVAAERLRWIRGQPRRRARRRALAAVIAALALAAAASSAGFLHARRSQLRAESARAEAEAVSGFLRGMLASAAPARQGIDTRVVEVLDAAAASVDADFAAHPLSRATVHFTLGETYLSLGAWSAAREQLSTALEVRRRELGPDHRETLAAEVLAAVALSGQGRWAEAELELRRALERSRSAFGDGDEDTVAAAARLAVVLQRLGRLDEAEPMVREEAAWKRRTLGDEHGSTLDARLSLANLLTRAGRSDEAEVEYREILATRARVFGGDHPDTLAAAANLGALLSRNEARAAEAEQLLGDTLERRRRVLGAEHPETLRSLDVYAVLMRRLGRYEDAERLAREVLEIRIRSLGLNHPDTLESQMSLAVVLGKQGRLDDAELLLRGALAAAESTLGADHRTTLNLLGNLGNLLVAGGRLGEAEAIQRRMLDSMRRSLGDDHPSALSAANNLANALIAQGKLDEAAPLVAETLARERRVLGPGHPSTLNALGNQARLLAGLGRLDEAAAAFRDLVEASERVFGPDHPRTVQARQDLAALPSDAGRRPTGR